MNQELVNANIKCLQDFYGVTFEYEPERQRFVTKGATGKVILSVSETNGEIFGFSGPDQLPPNRPKRMK